MMENRSGGVNKGEGGVVSNKQKVRQAAKAKSIALLGFSIEKKKS